MKKLLLTLLTALLMWSCVDMAYDKDIDMKITLAENGVTIPIGETERFTLSKLIDDDEDLKTDDEGNYYIAESASSTTEFASMASFTIESVNGMSPAINPTYIDVPEELRSFIAVGVSDVEAHITVPMMEHAPIDPSNIEIPKEILRIDTILFDTPKRATLRFVAEVLEPSSNSDMSLTLKDFHIELPRMLILAPAGRIDYVELKDMNDDGTPIVIENHDLKIAELTSPTGEFELHLDIYGVYGGALGADGTNNFVITPGIDHNTLDVINNEVYLHGDAIVNIELHGSTELVDKPSLRTYFTIEDMTIYRVSGLVDASAEESFSINIGSMPDFLNSDDINLDLHNPYITLSVVNPMGIPVMAHLTIDPRDEQGESMLSAPIAIDPIYVQGAAYNAADKCMTPAPNNIYVSLYEPTTEWVDAEAKTFYYENCLYTWVKGNLPALLDAGIPYTLDAHISAETDKSTVHNVVLNDETNVISIDADITVPLKFGENFSLSYSDIEGGLDDIFQDVSAREASIIAGYTTTLPLDMQFDLVPMQELDYDTEGGAAEDIVTDEDSGRKYRVLRNVTVEILDSDESGAGIIAGTTDTSLDNPTPSTDKIVIKLNETEAEALKSLTHIKWRVQGDLAEGLKSGTLRDTQYLQLRLSAKIAKIEVDLDEL
ncbi:MAG: hypothetical protein IJY36_08230 [Coprobacter sp.]|nr:hypothetical protein [Coprobacter sp.]